jgi:hypothetical protein
MSDKGGSELRLNPIREPASRLSGNRKAKVLRGPFPECPLRLFIVDGAFGH